MKRVAAAVLISICVLPALCGCGVKAAVTAAALTEREKALLSAESEQSFVFDYDAGGWKWASLWAEEYRKGEKAGTYDLSAWSLDMGSKGTMIFYMPRTDGTDTKQFNVSMIQGGAIISRADTIPDFLKSEGSFSWQTCPSPDIPESGRKVLLCVRCSKDGFSPLGDFFSGGEISTEEIADDEATYVIGCTFSNEQPDLNQGERSD